MASPQTWTAHLALWDAINAYVRACGGDPGIATISEARMGSVVEVERALAARLASANLADRSARGGGFVGGELDAAGSSASRTCARGAGR